MSGEKLDNLYLQTFHFDCQTSIKGRISSLEENNLRFLDRKTALGKNHPKHFLTLTNKLETKSKLFRTPKFPNF